ncbi:MAG: sigma-70 family RNA polymerase sigma factor [Myxococcota bacterium]
MSRLAPRHADRAFEALVEQHYALVWSICRSVLSERALADEVVQDVFVGLWQHGPPTGDVGEIRAWLRTVARRRAIDRLRQRTRQTRLHAAASHRDPEPVDGTAHVAIGEAMGRLPDDERALLVRFHIEGASSKAVAEELGISDAAVRKRLSRARESLRVVYEEELRAWATPVRSASAIAAAVLALGVKAHARPVQPGWWAGLAALVVVGAVLVGVLRVRSVGSSHAVSVPGVDPRHAEATSTVATTREPVAVWVGLPGLDALDRSSATILMFEPTQILPSADDPVFADDARVRSLVEAIEADAEHLRAALDSPDVPLPDESAPTRFGVLAAELGIGIDGAPVDERPWEALLALEAERQRVRQGLRARQVDAEAVVRERFGVGPDDSPEASQVFWALVRGPTDDLLDAARRLAVRPPGRIRDLARAYELEALGNRLSTTHEPERAGALAFELLAETDDTAIAKQALRRLTQSSQEMVEITPDQEAALWHARDEFPDLTHSIAMFAMSLSFEAGQYDTAAEWWQVAIAHATDEGCRCTFPDPDAPPDMDEARCGIRCFELERPAVQLRALDVLASVTWQDALRAAALRCHVGHSKVREGRMAGTFDGTSWIWQSVHADPAFAACVSTAPADPVPTAGQPVTLAVGRARP